MKIVGTQGFQVVVVGELPPQMASMSEDQVSTWVLAQLSMTFVLGTCVHQSTVTVVPLGPGEN